MSIAETFLTERDLREFEAAEAAAFAAIDETPFIRPARYARGMIAVSCLLRTLQPTQAYRIAALLAVRYSERESAWILSPQSAQLFANIMEIVR
jgi:hypothetical protein